MVYPHSYRTQSSETRTTSSEYGEYFKKHKISKIKVPPSFGALLQYIDTFRDRMIDDLDEFVAIPSFSADKAHYRDVLRMLKKVESWFIKLNIKYEAFELGKHPTWLPDVLIGQYITSPKKKTICVYHHIDIIYTDPKEWASSCPTKVTKSNKNLYGAGVASGKGPLLMWLHAIQTFQECNYEIPVNIIILVDPLYGSGTEHKLIEQFLRTRTMNIYRNIDHWIVHSTTWLGDKIPCLSYGATGYAHLKLTATQRRPENDPKEDMINFLATVCNEDGHILVPGVHHAVEHITPDEEITYEHIRDFDPKTIRDSLPDFMKGWDKIKLLMNFWRLPSIKVTPIEECICERGNEFPKQVKCNLLCKIVPFQIPDRKIKVLEDHLKEYSKEMPDASKLEFTLIHSMRPFKERRDTEPYIAARRATLQIYKEVPNDIREDEPHAILLVLFRVFKKPILMLPLCERSSNMRKPNEKISERCFFEGTKLLVAYLIQLVEAYKITNITDLQ